jgi:hypothetical protein
MRNVYNILVGRLEEKLPLRRPRHKWEDNIKMDHRGIGLEDMDWFYLAEDGDQWQTLVKMIGNLRVP